MKRRGFLGVLLSTVAGIMFALNPFAWAQRGRGGGGRGGGRGGSANRSGAARSGSTKKSKGSSSQQSNKKKSTGGKSNKRQSSGRRSSQRNRSGSSRHRSRKRTRRVSRSRRHRRGRWHHHRWRRHRRWYRGRWVGLVFITVIAFAAISSSATTYSYHTVTYYHVNPWYRKVMYEGEEGYMLTTAPVGHKVEELPDGAEEVTVDSHKYFYADWSFFKQVSGGYEVVAPPVGAEVSSIPEEAIREEESGRVLHQFDDLYFSEDKNDAGKKIYRVEPQPPDEEIDSIPSGSPSFVADEETFYYVNYNFYVEFEENGKRGYVNGEPEIGAQTDKLPEGTTEIEEKGQKYYQFDSVFFEEVEDDDGTVFFEVVGSPDGDEEELAN
jgi:hypothetical protein